MQCINNALSVICNTPIQLPAPPEISDEELLKLIETEDPSKFRIPLSLGEPHAEMDHGMYVHKIQLCVHVNILD